MYFQNQLNRLWSQLCLYPWWEAYESWMTVIHVDLMHICLLLECGLFVKVVESKFQVNASFRLLLILLSCSRLSRGWIVFRGSRSPDYPNRPARLSRKVKPSRKLTLSCLNSYIYVPRYPLPLPSTIMRLTGIIGSWVNGWQLYISSR